MVNIDRIDETVFSPDGVAERARGLFKDQLHEINRRTDRLFAVLMVGQWLGGIVAAWSLSPLAWNGAQSEFHPHLYAAVLLGGLIAALPVALAVVRPGATVTRYTIAVAQMLFSALLIHLSGGRIETHFHVFGSLAFLAAYRDWRLLLTASAVVGIDHFARGVLWPQSVFGVASPSHWRWLEHVGWVVFEDLFLLVSMRYSMTEMRGVAERQATIERAKHVIEAADRAKTAFLANVSHEIRTPLTAILGYNDLMRANHQTPDERLDCVQTIARNGRHLLTILNDILDLSKIEAGQLTVESLRCSPYQLALDVVNSLHPRAAEKAITLRLIMATPLPATIATDPTRLRQVLANLVSNAIKFTQSGGVRVELSVTAGARPEVLLSVVDTGIGMTVEQQRGLFRPFSQADVSTSRKYGGTGLGLSISKRLAEMLGGRIAFTSTPGAGSTFTLALPAGSLAGVEMLKTPPAPEEPCDTNVDRPSAAALPQPVSSPRLLLADDSRDNRRLLKKLLQAAGFRAETVDDGAQAVARALASMNGQIDPYDVILMDMQMPELDGYGASAQLRAQGYRGRIVALTAHASESDRERCLAAGCDDYMSKPFDVDALMQMLHAHAAAARDERAPAVAATPA